MKNTLPSLITQDTQSGLALAGELAELLHGQLERAAEGVQSPGGTNYLRPTRVPKEIVAGVLFYAIAAANAGWTATPQKSA